jgi:hypothetical protein
VKQHTLLVTDRQTGHIPMLGIKSVKEIPENDDGSKPIGWWLAALADFDGRACPYRDGAAQQSAEDAVVDGTAAIAVNQGAIKGILSPNDGSPAVWWSWPLDELSLHLGGSQGFLKKRPTDIWVEHENGSLHLKTVSRLWRNSGRYQDGQEGSFIKALGDIRVGAA